MSFLNLHQAEAHSTLAFQSDWQRAHYDALLAAFDGLKTGEINQALSLDLTAMTSLDSYGALLIHKFAARLREMGHHVTFLEMDAKFQHLLESLQITDVEIVTPPLQSQNPIVALGKSVSLFSKDVKAIIAFFGHVIVSLFASFFQPKNFYFKAFSAQCYKVGVTSLPVVGLLSFLIGIVMAYQGAEQLEKFGAEIFVVDLLGISILREIGVLMTAIIVAGRVGSAFTAEIGMMQVNEEVDAIQLIGLDEFHCLINPRVLALAFSMIFIVFFANVMGLLGGAFICDVFLDINYLQFYSQLTTVVSLSNLGFGLMKAPIFGLIISILGCYHGLTVERKADAVGLKTTRSVVHSIFMIIVVDAFFAILSSVSS